MFISDDSVLGEEPWIKPNVVFTNIRYPAFVNAKKHLMGPVIKRGVKIGTNATLLFGVANPAKVLKNISDLPYE